MSSVPILAEIWMRRCQYDWKKLSCEEKGMTEARMYWQDEFERMDREELEQLQLERLESTLSRVYMNVPFYHKKFDEVGFEPDDFRSMDDLRKLPFTSKDDLRDNYPYGMFAVPLREVVRVHASSGTTGMSTVVGYTKNDISRWADPGGENPYRRWGHQGRRCPDRFWLWTLYRWVRSALWCGEDRRFGDSHFQRKYPATDKDNAGFQDHGSGVYSKLCHADRRHSAGDGSKHKFIVSKVWSFWGRALE